MNPNYPKPTTIEELSRFGKMAQTSGLFKDLRSAAAACVKIQTGAELGIAPMQSLSSIHVIEGKPTLSSNATAALFQRAGYSWKVLKKDRQGCSLEISKDGEVKGIETFDLEDAKAAGLLNKSNWKKYPKAMYFSRCIMAAARTFAPGATLGLYTPEELEQSFEAPVEVAPAPTQEAPAVEAPFVVVSDLEREADEEIDEEVALLASAPVDEKKEWNLQSRRFHALLKELKIDREELKIAIGVESLKETTSHQLQHVNRDLDAGLSFHFDMIDSSKDLETLKNHFTRAFQEAPLYLRPFIVARKDARKDALLEVQAA